MTAREWLEATLADLRELQRLEARREYLECRCQPKGQRLGTIGHSSGGDFTGPIDELMAAEGLVDSQRIRYERGANLALNVLYGPHQDGRGGLAGLKGERYADVLNLRYLQGMSMQEVADTLGYTRRWAISLHNYGIKTIDGMGIRALSEREC